MTAAGAGWAGELLETLTLRAGFNTTTVIVGTTLLGVASGVVGTFALLRKRSLVADALSHATLPGIAIAFLTAAALGINGRSLPVLLTGAAVTGVLGVLCVQWLLRWTRLREDAAIGIVLSTFFGAGVVLLSYIQKNAGANAAGLNAFIYGQTAAMRVPDAALMAGIAALSIACSLAFLKEFALVSFDDVFARVDGWAVARIDLVMMALVVLVTVAGLQAVGLILVIALLIIPPVAARFWTDRMRTLVLLSGVMGGACGYIGSVASSMLPRKPAGAVIVLTAGAVFLLSMAFAPRRGAIAAGFRRARRRIRIDADHVLETAVEAAIGAGDEDYALDAKELAAIARERGWNAPTRPVVVTLLSLQRLIRREGGGVRLTESGIARGRTVMRNHALWERYLTEHADVAPGHVDWSADEVEHVLPPELIAQLERDLKASRPGGAA